MANIFSNLFAKKDQSVIGLDIGSSSIKIVQLTQQNGHAVLETYGELALGPYTGKAIGEATSLPPNKIVEAVNDLFKEKEVNITTRKCGVAIPFSSSLMAVIEMPVMSQKDLAQAIPIEARKYIPVPIAEVALDWYIIPKDRNPEDISEPTSDPDAKSERQKLEVLVVALHNDTITRYKDIVTKTNLEANFFEIEIFSTMRSILDQEVTPVLIVDMGATTTKLYIIERGILRSSHIINRGSQSITDEISRTLGITVTEAEVLKRDKGLIVGADGVSIKEVVTTTLNYVFSEANRVILAYQKKYTKNVSKVVLVGGGSALKGIVDIAKTNFQTEVVGGDPFSKVVAPAFLEQVLKDTGPEFAVAVGVALRRLQELN